MAVMPHQDAFEDLARFYDPIMSQVNYDRWLTVCTALAELQPRTPFAHVDIGCGTSVLMKKLVRLGWNTRGVDLSWAMLLAGRKSGPKPVVACADMRALPFARGSCDYLTCLFDSVNFLLDPADLGPTFREAGRILAPHGIYYFDVITSRMVTEYFEGRKWTEKNGRFSTTWEGAFDRKTGVAETAIQVNRNFISVVRERVHSMDEIRAALGDAGLTLLGAFDAETWKVPVKRTLRIDLIAAKEPAADVRRKFKAIEEQLRERME